jgi:hypothetical protein
VVTQPLQHRPEVLKMGAPRLAGDKNIVEEHKHEVAGESDDNSGKSEHDQ